MFRLVIFSFLFLATFALAVSESRTKPTQQRIVGGRNTDITLVPHQVSVRYDSNHVCGGSIIGPKHVLTAAHCVEDKNPALFSIRAGSSYYYKGGEKIIVGKVIPHPKYDTDTVDYDAAVLVLKARLKLGREAKIATLASVEPKEGDMILISGWGLTRKYGRPADFLQSVSLPVISKKLCIKKYVGSDITDRMFCAVHLKGGKDSCDGDSGGPAMVKGKLAGIVSWGDGCGDARYPGVYTNIVNIKHWISAQTRQ